MRYALLSASILVVLLALSALLAGSVSQARADDESCWEEPIGPKGECDTPTTPEPDPCLPSPDGGCGEPVFPPGSDVCTMCGNAIAFCPISVWWGGAFGSWMLVLGVMGWLAWPLWRHRKKWSVSVMDERQTDEEPAP